MKISHLIITALFSFSAIVMGISYKDQITSWISSPAFNRNADLNAERKRLQNTTQENRERVCQRRWKTNQKMVGFCIRKLERGE
ncbi:MAG: hypothetical protein ACRBBN_05540 [Methyloligellaceae bacterium]